MGLTRTATCPITSFVTVHTYTRESVDFTPNLTDYGYSLTYTVRSQRSRFSRTSHDGKRLLSESAAAYCYFDWRERRRTRITDQNHRHASGLQGLHLKDSSSRTASGLTCTSTNMIKQIDINLSFIVPQLYELSRRLEHYATTIDGYYTEQTRENVSGCGGCTTIRGITKQRSVAKLQRALPANCRNFSSLSR